MVTDACNLLYYNDECNDTDEGIYFYQQLFSMEWFTLLLVLITMALIIAAVWITPPKNYPPGLLCSPRFQTVMFITIASGPIPVPLLGSLVEVAMTEAPTKHDLTWKMAKKYGPVMGTHLGPWPVVIVSDYTSAKEVLSRDDLSYRPKILPVNSYFFNKRLGMCFIYLL